MRWAAEPTRWPAWSAGTRYYATGFVLSTVGFGVAGTFDQFLIAHGGGALVIPDGRLHADDEQVRQAR